MFFKMTQHKSSGKKFILRIALYNNHPKLTLLNPRQKDYEKNPSFGVLCRLGFCQ